MWDKADSYVKHDSFFLFGMEYDSFHGKSSPPQIHQIQKLKFLGSHPN